MYSKYAINLKIDKANNFMGEMIILLFVRKYFMLNKFSLIRMIIHIIQR